MPPPRLVLYGYFRSSSSYRVRLAIAWKKLAYETVPVNLLQGEQNEAAHGARSPTGYVPCLEMDGRRFVESGAILELLEELFPDPPLYPRDPYERARVRAMVEVVNAGIQPLQNLGVLARVSEEGPPRRAWAAHYNERGLGVLARMVHEAHAERGAGPFCFGEDPTAADVVLVPQLYSARRFGVEVERWPDLLRAEEALLALPGVAEAVPERQPDVRT